MIFLRRLYFALAALLLILLSACQSVNDDRLPVAPVNINLGNSALWNTYGVSGFGIYRYFILNGSTKEPAGFSYSAMSSTGFGGVLLIGGMNPFSNETDVPLAYDLACPVECKSDIRVRIDNETFAAVCPECGSTFDVTMAAGAPLSGPAATGSHKYGLRRYQCLKTDNGGYMIIN